MNSTDSARTTIRPGTDERGAVEEGAGTPPGAEDDQLGGGRAGHQVADGDGVLELAAVQPAPALDAQLAQQPDVRGRPAEADAADPAPFPEYCRERHLGQGRTASVSGALTMIKASRWP
jgi:hypothetical protein